MPLKQLLPPNIFDTLERSGLSTIKKIILLSIWDIKKCTKLSIDDILLLKNIVSKYICPHSICSKTMKKDTSAQISTGCNVIDDLLHGGFRKGTITEIYGESGCGKTQIALQTTLWNSINGCVYICTEDLFPTKRFEEMKSYLPSAEQNIGDNVFVQHVTEAKDLLFCIRVHLLNLLASKKVEFIVIDSIAAPYRCESTNYIKRAEELREIGFLLTSIAQKNNIAIVCINQVTANFADSDSCLPSLGLAWSNMVVTRLMIRKTNKLANVGIFNDQKHNIYLRELWVMFAPDLPNSMTEIVITCKGIKGIKT